MRRVFPMPGLVITIDFQSINHHIHYGDQDALSSVRCSPPSIMIILAVTVTPINCDGRAFPLQNRILGNEVPIPVGMYESSHNAIYISLTGVI